MANLYNYNANCDLPCWWDAIPGETSWNLVGQLLSSFASGFWQSDPEFITRNGEQYYRIDYGVSYPMKGQASDGYVYYRATNGIIDRIGVSSQSTQSNYQLHHMLSYYGMPDRVFVRGWPYNDDRVPHYDFLVFYTKKGIMARYAGDAFTDAIKMQICPQNISPGLDLWNPEEDIVDELVSYYRDIWAAPDFLPLQEATKMDIASFYQLMQDPNACFETPLSLWDDRDFGVTVTPTPGK